MGGSAAIVGILLLLLVQDTSSPWMLYAFVILFGLGNGSCGPIGAAATADLFPGNSLGRILGTSTIWWGLAAALGAYLGGYFYDQIGSYTLPFLLVMISICLGILGIWMAAPRHRRTPSVSQAG
jgi:MFS family permease